MARSRYDLSETRIAKFQKEGRGKGAGRNYKPWLTISDVSSSGRVHRVFWSVTGREHHLLSDNEFYAFLIHWRAGADDICEQFPLDRRETMEIAARLGIRHPIDPISRAVWVITTDLVVTHGTPRGPALSAYAVKETKDLGNPRVLEKLEIERCYWSRRNIPWSLMTSDDLKTNFTRNLAWLFDPGPLSPSDERQRQIDDELFPHLVEAIYWKSGQPIRIICLELDCALRLEPGRMLACLRRMLAAKRIRAPLGAKLVPDLPGSAFLL
jgi:hypothetical protein